MKKGLMTALNKVNEEDKVKGKEEKKEDLKNNIYAQFAWISWCSGIDLFIHLAIVVMFFTKNVKTTT